MQEREERATRERERASERARARTHTHLRGVRDSERDHVLAGVFDEEVMLVQQLHLPHPQPPQLVEELEEPGERRSPERRQLGGGGVKVGVATAARIPMSPVTNTQASDCLNEGFISTQRFGDAAAEDLPDHQCEDCRVTAICSMMLDCSASSVHVGPYDGRQSWCPLLLPRVKTKRLHTLKT